MTAPLRHRGRWVRARLNRFWRRDSRRRATLEAAERPDVAVGITFGFQTVPSHPKDGPADLHGHHSTTDTSVRIEP
jgi:hypothetical protein